MVDEDFVMGYVCGFNDVKIIEKTITANGTYHAADDGADGFDPVIVNVDGMSQKDIDDLMDWLIDQIMPQLPDGTPEPVLPEIVVGDLRPTVDGYDKPFLLSKSDDGQTSQVMYGVNETHSSSLPAKHYYVDTFVNGVLSRHDSVLIVIDEGGSNSSHMNSDGTVTVVTTYASGESKTEIWGPYVTGNATVWSV